MAGTNIDGSCTLTIRDQKVGFSFSVNTLMLFADNRKITLADLERYITDHPNTSMRGLFFYAMVQAASEKGVQVTMDEFEFGRIMANLSADDFTTLIEAYKASKPEKKQTGEQTGKKKRSLIPRALRRSTV